MTRRTFLGSPLALRVADTRKLHAGAAIANVTPALGCSLAGNMTDHTGTEVHDEIQVKALVLDNGQARLAIGTIDSCAVPRPVLDRAKKLIAERTKIPASHVCLSATHSHSAPAATHLFQSMPDPKYVEMLASKIADAVRMAVNRLEEAQIGWGMGKEPRLLFNRRFHMKPGTVLKNPFGGIDQVKMNPGIMNPNVVKPAGPIDPDVGVVAVHTADGRPLAILGNYALHYVGGVGAGHISADYFPVWGSRLLKLAGAGERGTVTILSNACSGNINGVDVMAPRVTAPPYRRMQEVCDVLAAESLRVWKEIKFEKWVELNGSIEEIELGIRLPSAEDVAEAKRRVGENPGNQFKAVEDIYARESVFLARDYPKSVKVWNQGLRIGSLGIGTFPGEAFCELGLEVKRRSPLKTTMLIELANGYHGYIPTVEGHAQGGYETWRAKSSHLEVDAAPKMVAAVMRRLEAIA
jgi:hypothetical protein